ncbi:MAG: sporulation protein YabP [Clostridiales bacterium]|nr:sporulation protein YabP [Clostridiales bacterium]
MEKETKKQHTIELSNRCKCSMSGIDKVISSSDTAIILSSSYGGLEISGKSLKISKYDVDDGSLCFEGELDSIKYSAPKVPLLKRIFK